jgi:D-methionine transport system ATP-binding protein
VYKNIAYPLRLLGWDRERILDRVEELLEFVGLSDKALAYPSQLSGGQKQRVGIARALATRPDILISDESTSALDPQTTGEVLELLQRINREQGVTIALVTHEIDVIREIAHRVAVMDSGRVVEVGTVYDVFSAPRNPTSRRFVSSVLRHVPSPETLQRIRAVHSGRLVQVEVAEGEGRDVVLSRIAREHGLGVNVVYGGVDELQGRIFGNLTIELLGRESDVDAAIADLRATTLVAELDVPRPEAPQRDTHESETHQPATHQPATHQPVEETVHA